MANDLTITASDFPQPDDWDAWVGLWCREDTGNLDCVPDCLRPPIMDFVGPDGFLIEPEIFPKTPYKMARWFHIGSDRPMPPWFGSGLTPDAVKQIWEDVRSGVYAEREAAGGYTMEAPKALRAEPLPEAPRRLEKAKVERAAVEQADDDWPHLYFMGADEGPIKIGVSAEPERRLRQLQTGYPYKLKLLVVVPGACRQEPEYHARFAAHRLHGEWFTPHPDILAEIKRLNATPGPLA